MLPTYIYESLPAAYISVGIALISQSTNNLFLFSGTVFYICGAFIWIMRSNFRRKDGIYNRIKRIKIESNDC